MMQTSEAIDFLAEKESDPGALRDAFGGSAAAYRDVLFAALAAEDKRAKNRAAKLVAQLAEGDPALMKPRLPDLIERSRSPETILKWNAMIALGFLAPVDDGGRLEAVVPDLVGLLDDESMVTAGHAIRCLGRIAAAKPKLSDEIVGALLAVEGIERDVECRNILIGKCIAALEDVVGGGEVDQTAIIAFAQRHTESPRNATAKAAGRFVRRYGS